MSSIKLNCPKCAKLLKVPERAAGQKTKCPACKTIFAVPHLRRQEEEPEAEGVHSDDSIAGWILDDVDQTLDRRVEETERKVRPAAHATSENVRQQRLEDTRRRMNEMRQTNEVDREAQADSDDTVFLPAEAMKSPGKPIVAASGDADAGAGEDLSAAIEGIKQNAAAPGASATPPAAAAPPMQAESAVPAAIPGQTPRAAGGPVAEAEAGVMVTQLGRIHVRDLNARASTAESRYPQNLHINHPVPHLVVEQCTAQGVIMAFDSVWLDHLAFRTSMPIRCVFTGESDRDAMYARPLVFCDRSNAQVRTPAEVQAGHGQRLFEDVTARDLLDILGVINKMPPPFSQPMPYYVHDHATSRYLQCWTKRRPDEGTTCFVRIGNPRYALEWLSRVNGTCGPEYELLSEDVRRVARDPWQHLTEDLRKNLESWVHLKDGESFVAHVRDGELSTKDAGLGGIVLTDQRLLFRKYTKHGEYPLSEGGTIMVSPDADFAAVSIETGRGRIKMNTLRLDDVPRLEQLLQRWPRFKVLHE